MMEFNDQVIHEEFTDKYTKVMRSDDKNFNAHNWFRVVTAYDDMPVGEPVHFQEGPVKECGVNGVANEDILLMVITRLEEFQESEYACDENAQAIDYLMKAVECLRERTNKRIEAGIEGTSAVEAESETEETTDEIKVEPTEDAAVESTPAPEISDENAAFAVLKSVFDTGTSNKKVVVKTRLNDDVPEEDKEDNKITEDFVILKDNDDSDKKDNENSRVAEDFVILKDNDDSTEENNESEESTVVIKNEEKIVELEVELNEEDDNIIKKIHLL